MPSIRIYNFNNYYNRRLIIKATFADHGTPIYTEEGMNLNFNPSDGISTVLTAGRTGNVYNGTGDYLLYSDDNVSITSRWFIIENRRYRNGQFQMVLHRDVLADNWELIKTAPIFLEKATLSPDSPFIYNQEDMTVNQIKQGPDYLIKDETQIPWLVAYCIPNKEMSATAPKSSADIVINGIENDIFYQFSQGKVFKKTVPYSEGIEVCGLGATKEEKIKQIILKNSPLTQHYADEFKSGGANYNELDLAIVRAGGGPRAYNAFAQYDVSGLIVKKLNEAGVLNACVNSIPDYLDFQSDSDFVKLKDSQYLIIYDNSTGKYYQRKLILQSAGNIAVKVNPEGILAQAFQDYIVNDKNIITATNFEISKSVIPFGYYDAYTVNYVEIQGDNYNISIDSTVNKIDTEPYAFITAPYGKIKIYNDGVEKFETDANLNLSIMSELLRKYSSGDGKIIYDLQLLPYCPIRSAIQASGNFDIKNEQVFYISSTESGSTKTSGLIISGKTNKISFQINKEVTLTNKKIDNQTELYRIVSPNYDGQFEFNIAKNNGLSGFEIACTYKPFQPYIQVSPIFGGLYGVNYDDARGLICGGEFSLSVLTNSWESYQLSNKNYQRIFDRQIENMEVNNRIANQRLAWQVAAGTVQGAAGGAITGASTAGPQGAVIGAAVGGVASLAGGLADISLTKQTQAESIDYAKDQFGYNLGNIKALPNSLSKVSAFVVNNKIFPFLEHYTCTPEEKSALASKIAYNGMTVMAILTIASVINNKWSYEDITDKGYIKGKLIRLEDFAGDSHELAVIANELNLGVFTK